ncbi:hypothetical protein [Massilia sp. H6]|uniref:hypothetical protein n=1 Tax=Massilia sp. H6 TaxID=2970464 RepID=UPI002166C98A|nr:hypothetical protein [Massilia sp. H6]UVW29984.1 hypothetical protein NRS07_07670 [Massilia sp. H6]
MSRLLRHLLLLAAPLFIGGCATLSDSPHQQLELHAVLDYQEVAGVGCVLSNDKGRWFVVLPGRVTVTRSTQALVVSCQKDGMGRAEESIGARADTSSLMGNVVFSAGLGHLVDRHSGAGFSYPAHMTVLMQPVKPRQDVAAAQRIDSPVF